MDDSDLALMADVANGSERAFNRLVDRHQGAVRLFLRRVFGNAADADDAAQEAFLTAWMQPRSFRGQSSVRSWLCAIAWRKARGARRTNSRRDAREAMYLAQSGPNSLEGEALEDSLAIKQALMALPVNQRAAVVLCLALDFTHAEAADALGAPLGTVKSHVMRGRKYLADVLGGRS